MRPAELEHYLYTHIPLSRAMQVVVIEVSGNEIILEAPLAPNINHQDTVFGGSASAVAILAGWSLVHVRLAAAGIAAHLVIQRNTLHYDLPIRGRFAARARMADPDSWQTFVRTLTRRRKARLTVQCALTCGDTTVGHCEADYVATSASGCG